MVPLRPSTRFDLHLHSTRSDGRFAPDEVLRRCAAGGLEVIALTDHDLANNIPAGEHTVGERRLTVISGAEVSGMHERQEFHLLVYFPGEVPSTFSDFCTTQCRERASRYVAAAGNLGLPGIPPPQEAAVRGEVSLTRYHLAQHLVHGGHVPSVREAFARFLGDAVGKVPPLSLSFVDAIRFARSVGGITSWAHPPLASLSSCLPAFVEAGLQGLEALRPGLPGDARRRYRSIARRYGLVLTGGSDWHGWSDPDDLGLFSVETREIEPFVDLLLAA